MPRKAKDPRPFRPAVVRYVDRDGRRCKKSDPDSRPVREQLDTWYARLPGRGLTSLDTADEGVAWATMHRLLREDRERALGIRTPETDAALLPLAGLPGEYERVLVAGGASPKHAAGVRRGVEILVEAAGWRTAGQVSAETAALALAKLASTRSGNGKPGAGLSPQTRNHYRSHLRQFCRWLVDTGRLPRYPLAGLAGVPVDGDRRHDRRVPADDEVARLFAHLESDAARDRRGMSGRRRALGYRVCMATGLRAGELRRLTWAHLDLGASPSVERLGKNKRRQKIPLPAWLAERLRAWQVQGQGLWERFPRANPGYVLQADLAAAGIPYTTSGPHGKLYFDFHALRVWYATTLAADPQNDIKTVMEMMGHSTPTLTLKIYARAKEDRQRRAADGIPPPGPPLAG